MTSDSVILQIRSLYNTFTKSEKKIADAILGDPVKYADNSITFLSEQVASGDATIVRFCRKIGFQGFHGLRVALIKEIAQQDKEDISVARGRIKEADSLSDLAEKVSYAHTEAISDTKSMLDFSVVDTVSDLLTGASKIRFYAIGTSALAGAEAESRFTRINFNARHYRNGHEMIFDASLLTAADVVIGITQTGSTKDVVDALALAKEKKAKVVVVTHHKRSPATQCADYVLLTAAPESLVEGASLSQKYSQLFIVDLLYADVYRKTLERSLPYLEDIQNAMGAKIY